MSDGIITSSCGSVGCDEILVCVVGVLSALMIVLAECAAKNTVLARIGTTIMATIARHRITITA